MSWPIYFAQNLTIGNPAASIGLCLLWTPQERVVPALSPATYALAGNLYSREGISFLLRNVLARPTLRTILLCGRDMTGSGAALLALAAHGIDSEHRIVGEGTRLHPDIAPAAIELFRRSVRIVDARDVIRPAAIAERLAALLPAAPHHAAPFAPEPLIFPYSEPAAATLPAESSGFVLRQPTIQAASLALLWQVMTFGGQTGTQHSSSQRELLDVMTVVSDEPTDPAHFSHAPWMPFSRASLGERLPDGSFTGYLGQFLQAGQAGPDVSYTYGDRLRAFVCADVQRPLDQFAAIVADLQASGHSRRAVAALWHPPHDAGAPSPPCLNLIQARLRPDPAGDEQRLYLTAYFRSHDMYSAWAANAFGLRALQGLLVEQLSTLAAPAPVAAGDLVIISHSAHIYAHDWDRANELLAHHYRPNNPRLTRDPRGSFVVRVVPPALEVQHFSPHGEHLRTLRGPSAQALSRDLAPYVGQMSHALYLGQELQKAECALHLGHPEAYQQDRPLPTLHPSPTEYPIAKEHTLDEY